MVGGPWSMDRGPSWFMVRWPWSMMIMEHAPWSMVHGLCAMDHGQWTKVHDGPWTMVHDGPWSMDLHGPWSIGPCSMGHGQCTMLHGPPCSPVHCPTCHGMPWPAMACYGIHEPMSLEHRPWTVSHFSKPVRACILGDRVLV